MLTDAERDHMRDRMMRQSRVLRRLDAEAEARGITRDGTLRPSWYLYLAERGDLDVLAMTAEIHSANVEIRRLRDGVQERMDVLREFEDLARVIDIARGKGGRGW